jgi:hypothetical protein
VWSYCPGFVVTDIVLGDAERGKGGEAKNRGAGAETSETSATGDSGDSGDCGGEKGWGCEAVCGEV